MYSYPTCIEIVLASHKAMKHLPTFRLGRSFGGRIILEPNGNVDQLIESSHIFTV